MADIIRDATAHCRIAETESAIFKIGDSHGVFLYPYWGVPEIDEVVRHIMDEGKELVEVTRLLGERVGPNYAYTDIGADRKSGAADAAGKSVSTDR